MKHFRAKPLRPVSGRPVFLVDQLGVRVADPGNNIVGFINSADHSAVQPPSFLGGERLVYALPTNVTGGDLSLRYRPPWSFDEAGFIGMDFSNVIPAGVGISQANLFITTNTVPPVSAFSDFIGTVNPDDPTTFLADRIAGRAVYCDLGGGVNGTDYQLQWTVVDTDERVWERTALMLCASTS